VPALVAGARSDHRDSAAAGSLGGLISERAISMMSSRAAVGSSVFQATPMPIRKSTPLTLRSSKLRLGKSRVHCGAKPMSRPADTSEISANVSGDAAQPLKGY